jgi:hypothetical protein
MIAEQKHDKSGVDQKERSNVAQKFSRNYSLKFFALI